MKSLIGKAKHFFTERPVPSSVLQISSRYLCGLQASPTDRKIKNHFILPLDEGVIHPSLDKKNIRDAALLEKKLRENVEKLHLYNHKACLLIPELSQRTFVFALDSLPPSRQEREQIVRFRIKKQMPLLTDDTRISFDILETENGKKIVSSLAKAEIVRDFEDFFNQLRIKIRVISTPLLSLSNLIGGIKDKDFLLINLEEDSFSLIAVVDSVISLYRQKPLIVESTSQASLEIKVRNIVQEIQNTVNFIEDKEKKQIGTLWIRLEVLGSEEDVLKTLNENLSFPVKEVGSLLQMKLSKREKRILCPCLSQVL